MVECDGGSGDLNIPPSLIDVEVVEKFYDFCGVKCIRAPGPDTMDVVSLSKLCLKYLD